MSIFLFWAVILNLQSPINSLDLGDPPVNAVCRIVTRGDVIVEGMLPIIQGGYYGFHKNGFGHCNPLISDKVSCSYYMFNLNRFAYDGKLAAYGAKKTGEYVYPERYYLSSRQQGRYDNTTINKEDSMLINCFTTERYMSKVFHIYQELTISLWYGSEKRFKKNNVESLEIHVDDIKSFELLQNPSKKWTDLIQNARIRRDSVAIGWEDYQEPLWYHEIDEDQKQYLSKYIGNQRSL